MEEKSIATLLGVDDYDIHFNKILECSKSESEIVLRSISMLERMIVSVMNEVFMEQHYSSHDLGLLAILREKVIDSYWKNRAWTFLEILHRASVERKFVIRPVVAG